MYKNEFDNCLKQNKIFKSYMFYGQSSYLIERYALDIATILANGEDIEKIYFEEYDFKYIKNRLMQSSLFSSSNVILVKIDKKIPKKELDSLVEACNFNKDSYFILACLGETDFRSMESSFKDKNSSVFVRFFQPNNSEAISFLENEAKLLNLKYELSALNHLYFMHKTDLALCVNDLKKLAILDETINTQIVDSNCFGIGTVDFDAFLFNLLSYKDISDDLEKILEEGTNEIFILNQITSFVQQLFMISSYARVFGQVNAKEILGYIPPKHIWDAKAKLAINKHPKQFQEILEYLLKIELDFKTSKISNQNLYLQAALRKFTVLFR